MEISEHQEQVTVFKWATMVKARHPDLALLFAIPNGGHRHITVARKLKAEGVKAGIPDICLPVARGGWHGLYIELKTRKGWQSKPQKAWQAALIKQGYRAEVCRGWEQACWMIEEYLNTDSDFGDAACYPLSSAK